MTLLFLALKVYCEVEDSFIRGEQMSKKILLSGLLLFVLFLNPAMAVELEPIPSGADIVLLVNNHSNLPLGELLKAAPLPPVARQNIDEFMTATSFNPLKDVSRVQAMIKKGATRREDNAVVVLSGSFNQEKIMGFIKEKLAKEISEEKCGELTIYKPNDGKGGLCFVNNSKVAFGNLAALKVYLEALTGKEVSQDYDHFKAMLGEQVYAAVMVGGKEYLKKEMEKHKERHQARIEKRGPNPVAKWLEAYLSDGVEPQGIFVQLLNSKIEAKIIYNRADTKNNVIHGSFEINDPKINIDKMFGEFLKVISELPAPKPAEKPVQTPPTPGRW